MLMTKKNKIRCFFQIIFIFVLASRVFGENAVNLYSLDERWQDQNAKVSSLAQYKGKKIVFAMVYTSCQGACPLITKKMQKIFKQLSDKKPAVEFVIVSFDSDQDSIDRLKSFQTHMKLTGSNWHLLVGSPQSTRKLANLLDIKFAKRPKTNEIIHDNKILLFDEQGRLVKTLEGLGEDTADLF